MVRQVTQYDIYLVRLNPTQGSEIKKTRPCVVISPNEMNQSVRTVIVAPMTTTSREYPTRVPVTFKDKTGQIALDQIRTIDKSRLLRRVGELPQEVSRQVADVLVEIFAHNDAG